MQPVLTVAEMNEVDRRGLESVDLDALVGRAGRAVAIAALDLLGGAYGCRIVVGGGTRQQRGRRSHGGASSKGAGNGPGRGGGLGRDGRPGRPSHRRRLRHRVPRRVHPPPLAPGTSVLAVDIPSGVVGDTGAASGRPWSATRTVTFVALKPGLVQGDGAELAGEVRVADIGLAFGPAGISVVEDADVARLFPPWAHGGNKWSAAVLVVAGSPGMTGAASFVAAAAYRAGAGMVRLGVPGAPLAELPATEAVAVDLPTEGWAKDALEVAERCAAVVVGPGLGRADGTAAEVARLVADSPVPVVVDADGLYALGRLEAGRLADSRSRAG